MDYDVDVDVIAEPVHAVADVFAGQVVVLNYLHFVADNDPCDA